MIFTQSKILTFGECVADALTEKSVQILFERTCVYGKLKQLEKEGEVKVALSNSGLELSAGFGRLNRMSESQRNDILFSARFEKREGLYREVMPYMKDSDGNHSVNPKYLEASLRQFSVSPVGIAKPFIKTEMTGSGLAVVCQIETDDYDYQCGTVAQFRSAKLEAMA